jgi:hypothetical protein
MATEQTPQQVDRLPQPFEEAEARLRRVVTYQQYEDAEPQIVAYADSARHHLAALSHSAARHRDDLVHVLAVFEWVRLMLRAGRATCTSRLERAAMVDRYLGTQTFNPPVIRLDF